MGQGRLFRSLARSQTRCYDVPKDAFWRSAQGTSIKIWYFTVGSRARCDGGEREIVSTDMACSCAFYEEGMAWVVACSRDLNEKVMAWV